MCLGGTEGELLGRLNVPRDVGLKGSRMDCLVSSGSAGSSCGNGIKESAVVHWLAKES